MTKDRIPYISWRNGRPRFNPGVSLRAAGHKSCDLRHDDGSWYSFKEADEWSRRFGAEHGKGTPSNGNAYAAWRSPVHGFVYFLWAGSSMKIGFATNPWTRASQLLTGIGEPIRLYVAFPGTRKDEVRLHRRLQAQHVQGEWFRANEYTLEVVHMAMKEAEQLDQANARSNREQI